MKPRRDRIPIWWVVVLVLTLASPPAVGATGTRQDEWITDPVRQLAEKYAPIAMLKRQDGACDTTDEPYLPSPVDVVFDDPAVVLRHVEGAKPDPIVTSAPSVTDLAGRDSGPYLDLPGNPRNPRCAYERHYRQRMQGRAPTAYARIVVSQIFGDVALQYWFYYPFNDFNNTHESDWEMIQLRFNAASVTEALRQHPVAVAFAQHGGGETAAWDDPKLRKDGNHPIVYPAAGSHAAQFGSAVYLGWGEGGTGFGCDDSTGPSVRTPLTVAVIPNRPSRSTDSFAWVAFGGRWGERQPWEYNGPTGPQTKTQWSTPFSWQNQLRETSLEVPAARTFGPGPTNVFCDVVGFGARLLTLFGVYPKLVGGVVAAIMIGVVALLLVGRITLGAAWRLYRRHWLLFATLGLVLIPIGVAANGLQLLLVDYPPGKQIYQVMNATPFASLAAALTVGGLQQLVSLLVVGPAIVTAVGDVTVGRPASPRTAYRHVRGRLGTLLQAVIRRSLVVGLLVVSIVGIPWAIVRTVRWFFVSQAVMLDNATPRAAKLRSERAVHGHWWRTALTGLILVIIAATPGPLIGIFALIFAARSVEFTNAVSSVIYAVALPFSVIGFTVMYQDLQRRRGIVHGSASTTPPLVTNDRPR